MPEVYKKIFNEEQDFYTEFYFYEEFKEFALIPKMIRAVEKTLFLEYIDGDSIYDKEPDCQLGIAVTLGQFHRLSYNAETEMAIIHYDTNLSNYIWTENAVFMLDFTDIRLDSPLIDIYSSLLFFAEEHEPEAFNSFMIRYIELYFDNLGYKLAHSNNLLEQEIHRFEERREIFGKCINNYHYYLQNVRILKNYIGIGSMCEDLSQ